MRSADANPNLAIAALLAAGVRLARHADTDWELEHGFETA
jgi:hypothetical protein